MNHIIREFHLKHVSLHTKTPLMKKLFSFMLGMTLLASWNAAAQITFSQNPLFPSCVLLHYQAPAEPTYTQQNARLPFLLPMYFIYPDGPVNAEQATALVHEMGFDSELANYVGTILIINPTTGDDYDAVEDLKTYETVFNTRPVYVNLKVVGIGKGATFVNSSIAPIAAEVAGIVTIGGAAPKRVTEGATVPAYVAGKNAARVSKSFISRNKAVLVEEGKTRKVFANSEESLLRVVVNSAKDVGLKEIFADAWESLLSRNYRISNLGHTNYMGGRLGQYGEYELEPYPMFDRLGLRREICVKQITPRTKQVIANYLWYEYIPAQAENAADNTVPLLVLLHGHNNDPRTQAESSGFLQLAAEEGFILAELEWQGKGPYNYMDDDGIEVTIREILRRYPQIDPSRIYAEGMSAGGFAATALGIKKPYLFAAVGAHSGGLFDHNVSLGFPFQDSDGLWQAASFLRGNTAMPYFSIGGTADNGVPFLDTGHPNGILLFNAWKIYHYYNGFIVPEYPDTDKYPIFGIPLQNRRRVETNKQHAMEVGDVLIDGKPMLRIVAVENQGHGNFVPGARLMWEFFSHWSRDRKTFQPVWSD